MTPSLRLYVVDGNELESVTSGKLPGLTWPVPGVRVVECGVG